MTRIPIDAVVITGAGRGLGKASAVRLAASGLHVLCISKSDRASNLREELVAAGCKAEAIQVDLADPLKAYSATQEWINRRPFQRLGVLLAAGTLGTKGGLLDGDVSSWDETYRINVLGNLAVLKALMPRMLEAHFGRIISIAGGGAAYAYPLFSGYALSKTAMVRATENLHVELQGKGDFLTVCLAPGAMETDMLSEVRAAGGEVRTTVAIHEPVNFIATFIQSATCGFSGRFIHVRDPWREWLNPTPLDGDRCFLRRVER